MTAPTLSARALGRALLARQLLLGRVRRAAADVVEHLVTLQAQVPVDPYVALWTRLSAFDPAELSASIEARGVARAPLLRATIHLGTARDLLAIRPLVAPVLERNFRSGSPFGRRLPGVDMEEVLQVARVHLDERPRTRQELRVLLGARWPDRDADAMGTGVSLLEPVVQVTPRGLWGRSGQPTWARMETWLGAPLDRSGTLDGLVLRYLAAFGPASAADAGSWSGLTRLGEVFDRLRPRLTTFRSPAGRELFDLPDAPRPDPDTPAPVRFLPQYDNVLLGHADRSRIVREAARAGPPPDLWLGSVLVDGTVGASWRIVDEGSRSTLLVSPVADLAADEAREVTAEGEALLAFLRPAATAEVRLATTA